jgi:hypothetical protein
VKNEKGGMDVSGPRGFAHFWLVLAVFGGWHSAPKKKVVAATIAPPLK